MIELTRELLAKLPMSLRIEENAQRKDLLQSELAAVQELLIKELSKHKAPGSRTDLKPTSARKQAEVNEGHDKVEKRLAIAKAAKVEPGKFGKLKEDMDRTGRVDGPFKRLKVMRQAAAIRQEAPSLPGRGHIA